MDSSITNDVEPQQLPTKLMDVEQLRSEFRRLRLAMKLPQSDVAERLRVTQAALSAWETGKSQSMRIDKLNEAFRLVESWRADSNIVRIPPERIKALTRGREKPILEEDKQAKDKARQKIVRKIRARFGPESPIVEALGSMEWKSILELYVLSGMD